MVAVGDSRGWRCRGDGDKDEEDDDDEDDEEVDAVDRRDVK